LDKILVCTEKYHMGIITFDSLLYKYQFTLFDDAAHAGASAVAYAVVVYRGGAHIDSRCSIASENP
jgi:hypothetical protein